MSLAVGDIQDGVAYTLWSQSYAALGSDYRKSLIDEYAARVLTELKEFADHWSMPTGGSAAPDEWRPWYLRQTILSIAWNSHPDRVPVYQRGVNEAKVAALTTYTRKAIDYNPSSDAEAFTYTFQCLRYYILNLCIRQKPMLIPAVESVDAAIDWALKWVWNKGSWVYRRRQTIVTINTDSTMTFDLNNDEVFDSWGSWRLYYTDTPFDGSPLSWATADDMAQIKAQDSTTTGRPEFFRMESTGDDYTYHFSPAPDTTYTVRAEILVRPPANPTSGSDTTPFTRIASDHMQHFRDLALAKVLYDHNVPDPNTGRRKFDEVCARIDAEFAGYQDIGEPDTRGAASDIYQDWTYLPSGTVFGGGQ